MQALPRAGRAGGDDRRQVVGLPRDRGARHDLSENLAMIGDTHRVLSTPRWTRCSSTPSTSSTASAPTVTTPWRHWRQPMTSGAHWLILCDTNGGTLARRELVAIIRRGEETRAGAARDPRATTTPSAPSPTRWPRCAAGIGQVQGTLNGFGERCGNANLVSIIPSLISEDGARLHSEAESARAARGVSRFTLRAGSNRKPWSGRSPTSATRPSPTRGYARLGRAQKHPETYEHIDPGSVGNRRRVLVSELAGKSNILWKAREYGIDLDHDDAGLRDGSSTSSRRSRTRDSSSRAPRPRSSS